MEYSSQPSKMSGGENYSGIPYSQSLVNDPFSGYSGRQIYKRPITYVPSSLYELRNNSRRYS
jgi:hypothetical protein